MSLDAEFSQRGKEPHSIDGARSARHCHHHPHPASPHDRRGNRAFRVQT